MTGTANRSHFARLDNAIRSPQMGLRIFACVAALLSATGCATHFHGDKPSGTSQSSLTTSGAVTLAKGVIYRPVQLSANAGVDVIDIDLTVSPARPRIGIKGLELDRGAVVASAILPEEWLSAKRILAAFNGGYFGRTIGERKEILGLLVLNGSVRRAAPLIRTHTSPEMNIARACFGLETNARPSIHWAATVGQGRTGHVIRFDTPNPTAASLGRLWNVTEAIGCGPMLIYNGRTRITDRMERLVSEIDRPRTFLALDNGKQGHSHMIVAVATSMSYQNAADFSRSYFRNFHATGVRSAMCVDGGSSSQMSYQSPSGIESPRSTGMTVPDSIVIRNP